MMVDIYKNLHKDTFSVRCRKYRGRVVGTTDSYLVVGVRFAVQPAGRKKVVETKRKNVHAFVRGEGTELKPKIIEEILRDYKMVEMTYNPYECASFVEKDSRLPRSKAEFAVIFGKKVFAFEPE